MKNWICTKEFLPLSPLNQMLVGVARDDYPKSEIQNHHSLFRKTFELEKSSDTKYTIHITADDCYKLYINGTFIGRGPAGAYHDVYNYNVFDITDLLTDGKNAIGVHCFYHGLVNSAHTSGDHRQGVWAEVYADDKLLFVTDESWKYTIDESYEAKGKPWGYNTQFPEYIDRRKHPKGWESIDYDDSKWENAVVKKDDDHIISEQLTPTVVSYEVHPESIHTFQKGRYLLDFGKEIVGNPCLKVNGKAGDTVRIMCAEELTDDGHARYNMRCYVVFDETWTLRDGEDIIENFDYMGFRYMEVETDCDYICPEMFCVVARHYPADKIRHFHSENELLSKIWDICENAVIISTQEGYYDCPTREKAQYLGDLIITAMSHYYLTGDTRPFKKALTDFANTGKVCDWLMCVAPSSHKHDIADYSLLFPLALYNYWCISADRAFVCDMLPVGEKMLAHFASFAREDGLLDEVNTCWNMVDWPESSLDGYDFKLGHPVGKGVHNVINAYYYGAMKTMNILYDLTGESKHYDTDSFEKAYRDAFFDSDKKLFTDSETSDHTALHSNVLPYFFSMTTKEENEAIEKLIMEKGLAGGVYFSYFILKSLAEHGKKDEVMALMLNKSERSWYNMIKEGATACIEAWGKDQKWNTSWCHPWASTPIIILCEYFGF